MRKLVSICILLLNSLCYSQAPTAAIQLLEQRVLYRGYSNVILPAVTNNNGWEVQLLGSSNIELTKSEKNNQYIAKPTKGKLAYLYVVLVKGDSVDTVSQSRYRIMSLPDPTIYWGGAKTETKANIRSKKLFAKYPPYIPLNASFAVIEWSIRCGEETQSGKGSTISSAEELLKRFDPKSAVEIEVTTIGPDGVKRKQKGHWNVLPWEEESAEELLIVD